VDDPLDHDAMRMNGVMLMAQEQAGSGSPLFEHAPPNIVGMDEDDEDDPLAVNFGVDMEGPI